MNFKMRVIFFYSLMFLIGILYLMEIFNLLVLCILCIVLVIGYLIAVITDINETEDKG